MRGIVTLDAEEGGILGSQRQRDVMGSAGRQSRLTPAE
jgi:hypothetical protein